MRTVVGLFDQFDNAQKAVRALKNAGFRDNDINLIAPDQKGEYARQLGDRKAGTQEGNEAGEGAAVGAGTGAVVGGLGGFLLGIGALFIPGIGPVIAAGPIVATLIGAGVGAAAGGIVGALIGLGIPEDEANAYAEGVRRGGTLVTVRTEDNMAEKAVNIMNKYNPQDIDRRAATWRTTESWNIFDENAKPLKEELNIPVTGGQGESIPVMEENLVVGKREVESGGVKVHAYVEEKPVEKNVSLREENINVERRPVDRKATDKDKFVEGDATFKETHEEPVVNKQTRVKEEVHINKDVDQKQQTVSDTVRRQKVDVNNIDENEWSTREPRFRQHYQSKYANTGRTYNDYMPAYRYGYAYGRDNRFQDYTDWNQLEPTARQQWDSEGYRTGWNDVRDAARYGWEESRRR
jgi:uncharacterized protein (TIGR02271 family)